MSGESDEQAFVGSLARIDGEQGYKSLNGTAARLRVRSGTTAQGSGQQWDTGRTENGGARAVINGRR